MKAPQEQEIEQNSRHEAQDGKSGSTPHMRALLARAKAHINQVKRTSDGKRKST